MALLKRNNIWHVRAQVNGVMIAKSTKTSNRRVAEQLEAKWISEVHSEVVVANRRPITVEKAIAAYLNNQRGNKGHESAQIKFRLWSELNKHMLHQVTDKELHDIARNAVDEENYSVNTINVSIVYWNALQNYAKKAGFTPGVKIKRLKGASNRVRFLTDLEEKALLEQLDPNNGLFREKRKAQDNLDFVTMLLHTGAREQEIATMTLAQIDQKNGTLTIHRSKGGTDTTLKMSNAIIELVARRMVAAEGDWPEGRSLHGRTGNGFLFPERAEGRYNGEWMVRACNRAKLEDVSLHTLRHTFATRMLQAGINIVEVQHLLGHKNLQSTMIYAHLIPNTTADRAAAVLNA